MAREVDGDTFYHTRESGGTRISVGLQALPRDHRGRLPADASGTSTPSTSPTATTGARTTRALCIELLHGEHPARASNLFCYGQVESPYGSGQFIKDLREAIGEREDVALSEIADKEAIYDSIKDFLGKGK